MNFLKSPPYICRYFLKPETNASTELDSGHEVNCVNVSQKISTHGRFIFFISFFSYLIVGIEWWKRPKPQISSYLTKAKSH